MKNTMTVPALLLTALCGSAHAAGFALIEQSGSGMGNAYAGAAAVTDDASYQYFNPASISFLAGTHLSGALHVISPETKLKGESVKGFLTHIRPTDRVTVLGFNDNVFTLARPTVDLATRLKAIDRLAPWGGTALYDVVVQAFELLGRQTGRRALVLFTDGEDLNSRVPIEVAERRLEASDAVMYPIGQGRAPRLASLKTILERLPRKSGGRAFFGDSVDQLDADFGEILEELSNQFLLGYVPKDLTRDARWRTLKVEVPGKKDIHVRVQTGLPRRREVGWRKERR